MEQPKSQTQFDPNRTPFTSPAARFTYLDHPATYPGQLKINSDTLQVVPYKGQVYPGFPLKLPEALMNVPQPNIRTCGKPEKDGNRGCEAAVNGGCPLLQQYGRIGPVNIIIEKDGKVDSAPCYAVYCGISDAGRPTAQVHYLLDGWQILTDRTTIPENIRDPKTRQETIRYTEVPDLAPFYDHLKKPVEPPKKRGRPKKINVEMPSGNAA
jgi:hypothetical protein